MEPMWMMVLDSAVDVVVLAAIVVIAWSLRDAVKRQTRIAQKLAVVLEVLNGVEPSGESEKEEDGNS